MFYLNHVLENMQSIYPLCEVEYFNLFSMRYKAGIRIKTKGTAKINPEIIAMARGCCIPEPVPILNASGNNERIAII